jgi:hypothetical protein
MLVTIWGRANKDPATTRRRVHPPHGQARCHQGRVATLDRLRERRQPGGEDEREEHGQQAQDQDERVVAGVRVVRAQGEQHGGDDAAGDADEHEGLAHQELVGEESDEHQCSGVEGPNPVAQSVGSLLRVPEDRRHIDDQERDQGVVDDEEDADAQR